MAQPPEELFLDLVPSEVASGTCGEKTTEPWASLYCNAISEQRYGDAIYARYNMTERTSDVQITDPAVVADIKVDAVNYYLNYSETYAAALLFYQNNSSEDTRPEIIALIREVANQA